MLVFLVSPPFISGRKKGDPVYVERGEKTPTPKISALLRKPPVLLRATFVLTKDRKRPYYRHFVVKCTGRGLVVKRLGVLSKVQMLNRRNPKGDGGRGTGKKMSRQFATNVTTIYDMSRQFATFYDNFRLFIPLT